MFKLLIFFVLVPYTASVGGCVPYTGYKFHTNRDCKNYCDNDADCTAYTFPVDGSNWCETVKAIGASGDGRKDFTCYVKGTETEAPAPGKIYLWHLDVMKE